jgi:hypothetical protein
MGAVTVDQAKLVMNVFCTVFEDNLVTGEAVEWNVHSGEMDDRNKLTVVEQIGPRYKITRTQNGVKDLTAGTDGSVFGSEQFTIDGTFNANMGWSDFAAIQSIGDARKSKALLGAATSLAEQIDAYILGIALLAPNNWTGTPGNSLAASVDVTAGYTRLKEEGVGDNDLRAILNYTDKMLLGDQVIKLPGVQPIAKDTYRQGFSGEINGLPTMFTNQLTTLTVGTRVAGAGAVNGAAQNVNYADVAISTANGRFLTQTMAVDGYAAGATIKNGEVFSLPGVYAYDNRKQALVSPARLEQFTVVGDFVADGGGAIAALRFFPAMVVPATGAGDNVNINSAQATVNAAPADNAVITFLGAASATLAPRLIIQKEAIVVDTIPLIMPATGIAMRKKLSNIPVTVRMWQWSDFYTGAHSVRWDVAMNGNIRERRRAVRINGA